MRRSVVLSLACVALLALAADKPEPKKFELTRDEQTLLELTNKARAAEKLPPLKADPILFQVARAHSANMLKKGEMKHELDGKNPVQRVEASGYDYKRVGENIAWTQDAPVEIAMKTWMESKVHRDNILNSNYTEIGLGLAGNAKGEVYYTQVFATPRKK
jgi:uncharacterized protein YkwD